MQNLWFSKESVLVKKFKNISLLTTLPPPSPLEHPIATLHPLAHPYAPPPPLLAHPCALLSPFGPPAFASFYLKMSVPKAEKSKIEKVWTRWENGRWDAGEDNYECDNGGDTKEKVERRLYDGPWRRWTACGEGETGSPGRRDFNSASKTTGMTFTARWRRVTGQR